MFVNADTLASLQIIQSENHPNSHMQGPNKSTSGSKESLSVFGLFFHLARTPQGKQKLRQIFLRPSLDLSVICERQVTISILLSSNNALVLQKLCNSLQKIKDIRSVVIHLQKGSIARKSSDQIGVWANLRTFSYHCLKVLEAIRELAGDKTAIMNKASGNR